MKYTETQLLQFARNNPQDLVKIINNHSDIDLISLILEILSSEVVDEKIVFPILNRLLKHVHATVRESALSGVASFYANKTMHPDILQKLKLIAQDDPSSLLKDYAKDILIKVK